MAETFVLFLQLSKNVSGDRVKIINKNKICCLPLSDLVDTSLQGVYVENRT